MRDAVLTCYVHVRSKSKVKVSGHNDKNAQLRVEFICSQYRQDCNFILRYFPHIIKTTYGHRWLCLWLYLRRGGILCDASRLSVSVSLSLRLSVCEHNNWNSYDLIFIEIGTIGNCQLRTDHIDFKHSPLKFKVTATRWKVTKGERNHEKYIYEPNVTKINKTVE